MEKFEKVKIAKLSRVYRAEKDLSQSELAKKAGVCQEQVSYMENEQFGKISDEKIFAIMRIIMPKGRNKK